jgi:CBS domain-containing protein
MRHGIIAVTPDVTVSVVARAMADYHVHCVAMVGVDHTQGRGHHLTWGLIDDVDLVLAAHRNALVSPAASIAATASVAVGEDETLERAAALMIEHSTSHVVVVGRSGLPSDMVSTREVVTLAAGRGSVTEPTCEA